MTHMNNNHGQKLAGKTAVITGGATGIGRAAAKRFIEEGAFVFIFGRRQEALDAAVADLGPNARAVAPRTNPRTAPDPVAPQRSGRAPQNPQRRRQSRRSSMRPESSIRSPAHSHDCSRASQSAHIRMPIEGTHEPLSIETATTKRSRLPVNEFENQQKLPTS